MTPTDEELLAAINGRYLGQMNTLDFSLGTEGRAQLALDLGLLIGTVMRLLDERRPKQNQATHLEAGPPGMCRLVNGQVVCD